MQQQTETVLKAAGAVLERKSKIDAAIADGVGNLQGLIMARLETERAFRRVEAAAAIGEPAAGLEKSRKAAMDAKSALEQTSLRLNGFRTVLGEMGGDFVTRYDELSAELPKHNAAVIAAFKAEWESASGVFALVLGRRRAIEAVLGQSLDLPEPAAAAVELGPDVARPAKTLAELGAAIKSIAAVKSIGERQLKAGLYRDPQAVYKVISDRLESRGIPKGTFVIAASFEPGRLDQLIELEHVRPILDRDQVQGVMVTAAKAGAIEQAARDKELRDSEARRHSNTGSETTRRPDLEAELNYRPTQADLDKDTRNRALLDAHVPLETTHGY